mmetsp:Transcript_1469/g.1404  ORF Transcript_1469/g.1404 Transcript_1469/m.1404 type:complete len:378 (-) Transcript_1469:49-1182(-)|eukprot:CAMPEP_0197837176 /NCGR_PEP_ID=MMETSP1437-20131217/31359_1 /TAXON_ID=49252 ORGANISM="Eucampia antarctica, Strain CCMP1452" /NCGR_SAMPLE_ID=MMETSP1437 /ASSEMBLY_ACC=CAM_ASM_001096 /LENGTH=377 /DNA_ID=CAMNT_0043444003 /DNA_START=61 /DNA_END=1194 /DNA_ORIENTATION=+
MSTAGQKVATVLSGKCHRAYPRISCNLSCSRLQGGVQVQVQQQQQQRSWQIQSNNDMRYFSNEKKKKKKKSSDDEEDKVASLSWQEKKEEAKKYRRALHEKKVSRQESLKTRRDGKTSRGSKRAAFREWFEPLRQKQSFEDREARRLNLPWKIRVAAIIERLPVVLPDKPKWEQDYMDLRSYLDTFGKVYPKELGFMPDDYADIEGSPTTEEDLLALLPEGFQPAPRETDADKTGDVKTLDRKLKERVYLALLPNQDNENTSTWTFPTVTLNDDEDETLLDAAKRALQKNVGSDLDLIYMSNCPLAVDTIAYPDEQREQYYGEKIFYIKVQRDEGDVDSERINNNSQDYAWLAREEMVDRVRQQSGEKAGNFFHFLL